MRPRTDVLATLRQRLVNAVHFGRLADGDRLPSARRLAAELDADPRVVAAAYDALVREGMVARRPGSRGYFAAVERAGAAALVPTAEWLVETLARGIDRGVGAGDFLDHARRALESTEVRAVCVECNDDQLGWLCGELAEDYGIRSTPVPLDALDALDDAASGAALRDAHLLVTTVPHAAALRPHARRLGVPLVLVTLRHELVSEVARRLAEGPVWFLCTDLRFVAKVRALYAGLPNGGRVRPVIVGGPGDLAGIPDGAAAWVMRTAAARAGAALARLATLPTARAFSADTARELLRHRVRLNLAAAR